jgi:hypothetical protein
MRFFIDWVRVEKGGGKPVAANGGTDARLGIDHGLF